MTVDRTVLLQQRVTQVYVVLIEVAHPMMGETLRVVNDDQDLVSNGETWVRGYCALELPDTLEGDRKASISIQNVNNAISSSLRSLVGPATVKFRVVRRDTPNTVEVEYPTLKVGNIRGDALVVRGDLISGHNKAEPFPRVTANRTTAPGLYL